ncbi:folate transporter 1 [Actinidia rufa]|uniref:Folate transporter 1 n=1 Tax=Actinidia rufa TaxID=165716 RepID=A0A7J0E1Q8_9ERIC|nr:folate transporter 1 [Actinidia rufa]
MSAWKSVNWQWENATAGAVAGLATVAFSHPLDVVRTRFQVSDGRTSNLPAYKNTSQALWTIARTEGLRGLYAGFYPAVLGSTISWSLYFFFYSKAKQRYLKGKQELTPVLHLASAAEAGALQVTHGAIQFTAYEELRKAVIDFRSEESEKEFSGVELLNTIDYATLGASSKLAAILVTYPFQQRPSKAGIPIYMDSWHAIKETARFEGLRGFTKASQQIC